MFGTFFASIGKYVVIGIFILTLIGCGSLYVWYTDSKISSLSQQVSALSIQAKSLQTANDAMKKDIADVQQAQSDANNTLEQIRTKSQTNDNNIRNQILNSTDVVTLQNNVNAQEQALIKALQALSNASQDSNK